MNKKIIKNKYKCINKMSDNQMSNYKKKNNYLLV